MMRRLLTGLLLSSAVAACVSTSQVSPQTAAGAQAQRPPATAQPPSRPAPAPTPAAPAAPAAAAPAAASDLKLPNAKDSVKFLAMGDMGSGDTPQYEVGKQMAAWHAKFPFDFCIMLGDNLYGSQEPNDFVTKFQTPYKPLIDAGVKFYAALGNHDNQTNRFYKPWSMNGERFYSYTKKNVKFIALDSDYLDPKQLKWLEDELKGTKEDWKIVYFHHPLYSSGGRHGSEDDLRLILEPLFVQNGVNVVYSGHDHIYERIKPQKGIYYFVSGSAGQLRPGDLKRSALTEAGFDQDQSFMINEIVGDDLYFQTITRTGKTVDSGSIHRQGKPAGAAIQK
jgi:predicted phosphodiesterase